MSNVTIQVWEIMIRCLSHKFAILMPLCFSSTKSFLDSRFMRTGLYFMWQHCMCKFVMFGWMSK